MRRRHQGRRSPDAAAGGAWTSALSAGEFVAIGSVGFEPVGQVAESMVLRIGRTGRYWGYHDCQYRSRRAQGNPSYDAAPGVPTSPLAVSGAGAPSATVVEVFDRARRIVLGRLSARCTALGGDGVLAAALSMAPMESEPGCLEFKVIGTAIRARGGRPLTQPFTSHLDGHGFAKLLGAGWVPVEFVVGMSIGVRHEDAGTHPGRFSSSNAELTGWSELATAVRADARRQLQRQGARRGANALIMAGSDVRLWKETCLRAVGAGGDAELHDVLVESTMTGSTVVRFQTEGLKRPRTLAVLPLGDRSRGAREQPAAGRRPGRRTSTAPEIGRPTGPAHPNAGGGDGR